MEQIRLANAFKDYCSTALGFDAVGIARAEPLEDQQEHLMEWLLRGYHGSMQYMERNSTARLDPRVILPSARSIVSVALSYDTPYHHSKQADTGKISRYAWGEDYHNVMLEKLNRAAAWLAEQIPGCQNKVYVDTGPVMEKQWACRAGIGWQGKNTNVISRKLGSYFFLGVIFTSAELEPDNPIKDYCGTCTACIDACPTGALVEPYLLDATRCISYWTIETKPEVEFPEHIINHLDGWLFGCDICQDVCPWNRFRKPTHEKAFYPKFEQTSLSLEIVLTMTVDQFREKFRSSPIKRVKLTGLQRNARMLLAAEQYQLLSVGHEHDHSQ